MGITNFLEEAAGAFAADKALEAVDPNAGFLAKAAAAVAGFEGVDKIKDMMADRAEAADQDQQPDASFEDDSQSDQ